MKVLYDFKCTEGHYTEGRWENNDPALSDATIECSECGLPAKWVFPAPHHTAERQSKAIRKIQILQQRQKDKDALKRSKFNQRDRTRRVVT